MTRFSPALVFAFFALPFLLPDSNVVRAQEEAEFDAAAYESLKKAEMEEDWRRNREYLERVHGDAPRRQHSLLSWTFQALGVRYTLALPFLGLLSFALALILVIRGGQYVGPALIFVVSMPFLMGLFGVIEGLIISYSRLASSEIAPKPNELAEGISLSLVAANVGMLMMAPAFLVATLGLFIRAMRGERGPIEKRST